jgi:hypothetical protein
MAGRGPLGSRSVNGISIGGLALLMAVLPLGCGGGDDGKSQTGGQRAATTTAPQRAATTRAHVGPRPAEPAELEVTRLARAAQSGDCSALDEIFPKESGMTPKICRSLLPTIEPALPPQVKTYGSGAVVTNRDGGTSILALDSDRRFKFVTSFSGQGPKAPVKNADDSMSYIVGAIRRGDCPVINRFSLTFDNIRGKKFCATQAIRQLHAALDRDYTASPSALGGDGSFASYGLDVKPHYFTLVFLATENGAYVFVTSARA